ncbi:hypothetical protein AC579_7539 [Pseudocercospora musae]|uniref:Uncharacterized protein n=1 Tax=Pseudocercospora musae TaxID=113226 RepID=A0A139IHT0_9PEZI|nr:hypothetical protein AC579_7539 [Pseudocercospora musae]
MLRTLPATAPATPNMDFPVAPRTVSRKQRLTALVSLPVPNCASTEWKNEYYKIVRMLRELLENWPLTPQGNWKQVVLEEALKTLHAIEDPTESPAGASRTDHVRWADVMVSRIVVEALWEDGTSVSFYDCQDALKLGRSRAAAMRLFAQAQSSWTRITQTSVGSEFSLS